MGLILFIEISYSVFSYIIIKYSNSALWGYILGFPFVLYHGICILYIRQVSSF